MQCLKFGGYNKNLCCENTNLFSKNDSLSSALCVHGLVHWVSERAPLQCIASPWRVGFTEHEAHSERHAFRAIDFDFDFEAGHGAFACPVG